ncbi:MAG: T9SS type A sorting domain-containing protein, partial [Bacteroidota bacterium]|nr:T9SS type A sorting domain-containing protein [Bacteroidota bacterium]
DSVRRYGVIRPGMSETQSWLLAVAEERMVSGERTVRWWRSCPEVGEEPFCEHPIRLVIGSPEGIVLTPRRLRFEGERGGAVPAAQAVELRPGGGLLMPWTLEPDVGWLEALPRSGDRMTVVSVRPTTTGLAEGLYRGRVEVRSSRPSSPPGVEVEYEVRSPAGIGSPAASEGLSLEPGFPNPVRTFAVIRYHIPEAGRASLVLYDVYGRRVATLSEGEHAAGAHTATLDAAPLAGGVYVCALSSGGKTVTRMIGVRR